MSNTIAYRFGDNLYLNITNRCPCHCTFCIRNLGDGVNQNEPLWLDKEPDFDAVRLALSGMDWSVYKEVVFCGFGEPTERLDLLVETARFVRAATDLPIRLNTNGLADLINGKKTAGILADVVDSVSVSLNAPTKETYNVLCKPDFGDRSFDAMLSFAADCKKVIKTVFFSVVDVLGAEQIADCEKLAQSLGIPLRIRKMTE